ncbi:DNA polymerase IV [Radicibacter daui]|uniref:DNA polymerase IV n=1 Tax=Radicibacter daui TaxID=3064829 RepID=UPI004046C629
MLEICRDCTRPIDRKTPPQIAGDRPGKSARCPFCGSPRLISHLELTSLSIAHLDCDAFYASVEKRDRPELASRAVIVGGTGPRGVVSTACYIARISGVRSAMPMFKALQLCPDAVVIKPDMARYVEAGRKVRSLMQDLTPLVEPLSIDEAFLDLGGTEALHGGPPALTLVRLARRIEQEVGVTVSIGLSHNKFLAKVASDLDKPRGFSIIGKAETLDFLAPKPVSLIWGVGKAMQQKLAGDGIHTIGQIRGLDEKLLMKRYGRMGPHLWRLSQGLDERKVEPDGVAKAISSETTFDKDIAGLAALRAILWPLCEKVAHRLRKAGFSAQTITLKLRTGDFKAVTRSRTLEAPTQLADTLFRTAAALLAPEATGAVRYRLIGVGCSHLRPGEDADPPDLLDPGLPKRKKVEAAMEALRGRMGDEAIMKGRALPSRKPHEPRPRIIDPLAPKPSKRESAADQQPPDGNGSSASRRADRT